MGTLTDIILFIDNTSKTIISVIDKLENMQKYFSSQFSILTEEREKAILYLQNEFFKDESIFPLAIVNVYTDSLKKKKETFNENYDKLKDKKNELKGKLKEIDQSRLLLIEKFKRNNRTLKKEEDNLIRAMESIENRILRYNRKIDGLSKGMGFLLKISGMRELQREKGKYLRARQNLLKNIESVRKRWQRQEKEIIKEINELKSEWINPHTEYSFLIERIKYLNEHKKEIIKKAAFSYALCHGSIEDEHSFDDSIGIMKKILNFSQINYCYDQYLHGIKEGMSCIAILKGINIGIISLRKSFDDVMQTRETYPFLPELILNVPEASVLISELICHLDNKILTDKNKEPNPIEFFERIKQFIDDNFSQEKLSLFFKSLGDELESATNDQW